MWNETSEFFRKDGTIDTARAEAAMRRARAEAMRTGLGDLKRTFLPERPGRSRRFW